MAVAADVSSDAIVASSVGDAPGSSSGNAAQADPADIEEMCRSIQARVRAFEQRELSQMRQGAILQRKLDTAEKELQEAERRRRSEDEEAVRRREEQRREQSSASEEKFLEETKALEAELHRGMEASRKREEELERSAREAQTKRRKLEADIAYWRHSGQLLLRESEAESPDGGARDTTTEAVGDEETQRLSAECEQMAAEIEAVQGSCQAMSEQLNEVQRLASSSRLEDTRLQARGAELEAAIARAESNARQAQERAVAAQQQEQALLAEIEAMQARIEQEARTSSHHVVSGASPEEVNHLKRKLADHQRTMDKLQLERTRLQEALRRHADLPHREAAGAGKELAVGGDADPFSEFVSWLAMLLFKSVLVRRFFCVHLGVLYSWILFLLWWMSTSSPAPLK